MPLLPRVLDAPAGVLAYRRALRRLTLERSDSCQHSNGRHPSDGNGHPEQERLRTAALAGPTLAQAVRAGSAPVLKEIRGMGKVFDFRGTGLLPANGGRITPLVFVQHIPVVANRPGVEDFLQLARVLKAQGLALQCATDREGNACLYNPFDVLCFQARGANQISCGNENMHIAVGEPWTLKQLRASAWLAQLAERKHGIPLGLADIDPGPGVVRVRRRGHTSHRNISAKAGFNDRSDPGPGYDWEYVKHAAEFFKKRGHMHGA
jgi:hypothetical protein